MQITRQTPIGKICIEDNGNAIVSVSFNAEQPISKQSPTALIEEAFIQLNEYLEGTRTSFTLPLEPEGTPFMQSVWKALRNIPYGTTASYKDIAEDIGNPKAYRAVGLANNRNPIAIIIPCHRVIGTNGTLVGYAEGLDMKKQLLSIEGVLLL